MCRGAWWTQSHLRQTHAALETHAAPLIGPSDLRQLHVAPPQVDVNGVLVVHDTPNPSHGGVEQSLLLVQGTLLLLLRQWTRVRQEAHVAHGKVPHTCRGRTPVSGSHPNQFHHPSLNTKCLPCFLCTDSYTQTYTLQNKMEKLPYKDTSDNVTSRMPYPEYGPGSCSSGMSLAGIHTGTQSDCIWGPPSRPQDWSGPPCCRDEVIKY